MARIPAGRSSLWSLLIDDGAQQPLPRSERIPRRRTRGVEVYSPAIPGLINQWYPSRGEARKAALRYATRFGEGCTIHWNRGHAAGQQPHYHVVCPNNRRLEGHFFYARRLPVKAPPDDRYARRRRWQRAFEADPFLDSIVDAVDKVGGFIGDALVPKVPKDVTDAVLAHARVALDMYGRPAWRRIVGEAQSLLRQNWPKMTPQQAVQIATQSASRAAAPRPQGSPGKLTQTQVRQRDLRRRQRMSSARRKQRPRRGF